MIFASFVLAVALSSFLLTSSFAITSSSSSTVFAFDESVNYQIHSNNDVRELKQLLLKGASRFKFDPHYVDSEGCHRLGLTNPQGCLLLNHDNPLTRYSNYSSSDDLIEFFKSDFFQGMRKHRGEGVAFTAAFCFKSAPDMCNTASTAFNNWLALADNFFDRAKNEVSGVEFILDGNAKPTKCLIGRWPELNSVWINTESPQAAFTSNDQTNDYYRYQIINDPESFSNWTWMAQQNYGKFSESASKYPYQLWEPDMQSDYLQYIDIYQTATSHPHQPGFHFAINTDLSMFELFVAEKTGRGYNSMVQSNSTDAVAVWVKSSSLGPMHLMLAKDTSSSSNAWSYKSVTVLSVSPYDLTVSDAQPLSAVTAGSSSSTYSSVKSIEIGDNKLNYVVLLSPEGVIQVHSINYSDKAESMLSLGSGLVATLDKASSGADKYEDLILLQNDALNNGFTAITLSTNNVDNKVSLRKYEVVLSTATEIVTSYISSIEVVSTSNDKNKISNCKFSAARSSVGGEAGGIFDLFIALSINDVILMKQVSLDPVKFSINSQTAFISVSVGRSISIDSSDKALVLANDWGYCYNSHTHNTRSYPTVCSSKPTLSEFALDMSMGLLDDWRSLLVSSLCKIDLTKEISLSSQPCFAVDSCSDSFIHGTINQGSKPYLSLGSTANGDPYFLDIHVGVPTSGAKINNGCGEPNRVDGLVLESLPLQMWLDNLEFKHNTL